MLEYFFVFTVLTKPFKQNVGYQFSTKRLIDLACETYSRDFSITSCIRFFFFFLKYKYILCGG